ncbi:MAG: F0F1 ATP synthase subunit gamma [Hyphomicrobiales bacterium]|nr:F0F1 ATP synthase subunit gamma [Hyphomicrobiales bacterium]
MASLKELRNRISSIQSTRKITRAMRMVAASKLRTSQEAAQAARPYAERMRQLLAKLTAHIDEGGGLAEMPLFAGTGKEEKHLFIIATADRGLCGGFNTSIVRLARERIQRVEGAGGKVQLICVGRKGFDILKREFGDRIIENWSLASTRHVEYRQVQQISARVEEMFEAGEVDVCELFYAHFDSVLSQKPTAHRLIPMRLSPDGGGEDAPEASGASAEFEPWEEELLAALLPKALRSQVFQALLENAASEQGARMSAMDNATRNAGEIVDRLTIVYNRTRQAAITKELIEIISGSEAL